MDILMFLENLKSIFKWRYILSENKDSRTLSETFL